jgi:chromosome segregation protein
LFLKALTIKGFKSFADKTTLEFEPGVTVVIGPNGSGKSNVVDSVAWVLGAQGARALRGGKMDDVIFAGTAHRPALGRAEVGLTIDNSAHLLPIDFTEVTLTRTLFRTGESEYAINGTPCRLLDIQELLSDSGIGRTQHVIVGQGQLDTVLNAKSEDRRSIIEEAAGILKYRKRKEKAERRLEATEGNLLRLNDLLREVRRQLRPLERQADAARRHDGLVAELKSIRLHLAGREIDQQRTRLDRLRQHKSEFVTHDNQLRGRLRGLDAQVIEAERALSLPGEDDVADVLTRVEALRERGRGLQALVVERLRGIDRDLDAAADEGVVESLVADAGAARAELAEVDTDRAALTATRDAVAVAEARVEAMRGEVESATAMSPELSVEGRERAAAEHAVESASAAARAAEQVATTLTSRADAVAAEEPSLRDALRKVEGQLAEIEPERSTISNDEHTVATLKRAFDADSAVALEDTDAGRARRASEETVEQHTVALRWAEGEASRWRARADTLAQALVEAHAAAGVERIGAVDGVVGPLIDHLQIESGADIAVAAALGDALDAIVVDGSRPAKAAIERLKRGDTQALLLVVRPDDATDVVQAPVPEGARALSDCVRAVGRTDLDRAIRRLLANVVLVEAGWGAALDLALAEPGIVAVTREGDRFGGGRVWRAGPGGRSAVTPAALAEATTKAEAAEAARDRAQSELAIERFALDNARRAEQELAAALRERKAEVDRAVDDITRRRRDFERRAAGLDERGALLTRRLTELTERVADLPTERAVADQAHADAEADLELARQRLAASRRAELVANERIAQRRAELDQLRHAANSLRRDFEVRAAEIEQRRAVLTRRLDEVERRLAQRPDEEAAANQRRAQLIAKRGSVEALGAALVERMSTADALAERLREQRRRQSEAARAAGGRLDGLRAERADAERRLGELRERQSRIDVDEAECRMRLEQAVENVRREFDCEPEAAIEAPIPEIEGGESLPQRGRELERELRLLGPINPLALSEYEALVERHEFLQQQLDDVKNSRRELQRVIHAVNAEISTIFQAAFDDVSRNFSELFALLFPGGSGRITLTQPDNLLDTGVEIEARPSGKTPRRLSLLSGGERSLAALAYLFAVFRARPSPFYMLDEVEAALDDVNLQRFLSLVDEFRHDAQLLIVSHQKRTMEAADVLYGVSMPPGGSSRVVSQRIRDLAFEDA